MRRWVIQSVLVLVLVLVQPHSSLPVVGTGKKKGGECHVISGDVWGNVR